MQPSSPGRYLPTLDGWRGLAITLVLLDHSGNELALLFESLGYRPNPHHLERLQGNTGQFGVHIFFALSGYLITSRLIVEATSRLRINLKEFYLRRLFRLQPAALTFLGSIGMLSIAGTIDVNLNSWLSALLFYANYYQGDLSWYVAHFWSLAVEEHFYLIWPALFSWIHDRFRLRAAIAGALLLILWQAIAIKFQIGMHDRWIFRTDMRAQFLMWGCALALVQREKRATAILKHLTTPAMCGTYLVVMCAAAFFEPEAWKPALVLRTAGAIAIAMVLLTTSSHPNMRISRMLEWAPLAWVGRISFSLYLWQQLFFVWTNTRTGWLGVLQSFPLNLPCAIIAASASYYLIEQPVIKRGRQVIHALRTK